MAKAPEVPEKYQQIVGVFSFTLKGRLMWCKLPGPGQFSVLQRYYRRLKETQDDSYGDLYLKVQAMTLDVMDTQFLEADDRDWTEAQLVNGSVDLLDLMPLLSGGKSRREADDDAQVEVAPKPARKAAPAKKVANAKRART